MLPRTRQVLLLLGDELTAQLLEACAGRARTEAELRELTGSSHATLTTRLNLLEARGLVEASEARGPRGRPAAAWSTLARDELELFGRIADQFVLDLLQAQVGNQQAGIRSPAREDLHVLSDDAPGSSR